ncbi:protein FAR-RED IMPAIRED RESPONSE 1-like [Carya illinoinensis]|uniref:protein FAR-RED IMPAIRED RESPONSE 1-like n=1 Tax=Carya illinoinensis TaxID=32201 RepID=UPI001C71D8EA|nr:protein FAR-RED IMPAIRED RESPONSE 1-like [Carya illinoinensis]
MDMDDDGRLRNVFWADARSRATYKYFGNVVTFDTTYLTNRYGMPFAPFVGVNHHGQSILLGAGLISSEDTETFTWLFQTWLTCMDGEAPKAIITDQDRAMKNAISLAFPNSRHRFCLWHILKKLPEKLGSHGAYKTGLKSQLQNCVYDSHTIEEFEGSWQVLITKYNLQENVWLKSLYAERTYWAPVFMKEVFWARMSTTQRSESMNAFFDGYVHAKTNLKEYVDQFDNALRKKIESESEADFQEVQKEVIGMLATLPALHRKDGVIATYHVECEVNADEFMKEVTHTVYFNEAECEVKCSCALFEMRGILCRHVLGIMRVNKVRSVLEKYILNRWRKDIKRTYTLIPSYYDLVDQRPEVSRYSCIIKKCYEVATNASSCDEHTEDMLTKLDAMNLGYCTNLPPSKVVVIHANSTTYASSKKMLSPHVVRRKGRPPSLRKKSMIEKVKPTTKKASQKGKRKQPHGIEDEVIGTCRNLFGQTVVGTQQNVPVEFEHPKNARPKFRRVFDVLSEADEDSAKEEARRQFLDALAYSKVEVVVKLQGWDADLTKRDLHWKQVSFNISSNWQIVAKTKSKYMAGTFTKKKKCTVSGVYSDITAWPGREREDGSEQMAYFGIKTAERVIEFECKSKVDKQMWTEGIQHMLNCRANLT